MIVIDTLGQAEARIACDTIQEEAARRGLAIVVADAFGEPIMISRMDRAAVSSVRIAANKPYSAARERKTTRAIGDASRDPAAGFDIGFYGDDRFTGWPGGIPVFVGDKVTGAVAVSGANDDLDDELASLGVDVVRRGL